MANRGPRPERGAIDGARLLPLEPHPDERGSFTEVFSAQWDTGIGPVQWSIVRSAPGVLRGMHLHRRHDEYIHVIEGRATIGLYDLRPDSPTSGCSAVYELDAAEPACLTFPAGIVHGWLFHEPSVHLQAVSETYADYGEDDNLGCHWSDLELGIDWPVEPTIVSARSSAFPSLAELRRQAHGTVSEV
jgi:dTDP-4-dehydrorhamnose 3,5-epimerase